MGVQSFVGRDRDCEVVSDLLEENRLVTLVGPGGVGKTRLAGEIETRLAERFSGGAFAVELSGAEGRKDVESIAARQLGVDSIDALLMRSSDDPVLLIVDNCESALEPASRLADALVERSDAISVLATSRSPLRAQAERVFEVRPLSLPDSDAEVDVLASDAVRLFLDRARSAGARWAEREADVAPDVARLVRKLDGVPLAIELAAARARLLGPKGIESLLEERLDVLKRPGEAKERHGSLRAVIASSYNPLDPDLQAFLRSLSVMSAPFNLELAHAVAGRPGESRPDSLERLHALVDVSLVDADADTEGSAQYRLLDSIRAFGREQLEENDESQAAREHFVDAVATRASDLARRALQSFTPEILGAIRDEFVHFAAAISWCIENDPSPARTYRIFVLFGGPTGARTEVAELGRRVRETWTESAALQAEVWAVIATAALLNGDYEDGAALAEQALAHGDATAIAKLWSHRTLGFAAALRGDIEEAEAQLDRAIACAEPMSGAFTRELRVSKAGICLDPARSHEVLAELHALGREAARQDEIVNVVWASVVSTSHHMLLEDIEAARRSAEAAAAVADRAGMPWTVATAHRVLGSVLSVAEGWDAARPHFRKALESTLSVGDVEGVAMALRAAAGAARHVGDEALARGLWSAIPPVRGLPVVRSIFYDLEESLLAELGLPAPLDGATLSRTARRLLDPGEEEGRARHEALSPVTAAAPTSTGAAAAPQRLRFDNCEVDLAMHQILRDGEVVHVEPQVFDLLVFLIEHRGKVVSFDEIFDGVWSDRFVSLSAVYSRIASVRRATGDDGRAQRVIRTVRGKGFSFVAELESA